MKEGAHLEDLGIDWDNIEMVFKEIGWEGMDCIKWLRMVTNCGV
jgi:hypothetical protein